MTCWYLVLTHSFKILVDNKCKVCLRYLKVIRNHEWVQVGLDKFYFPTEGFVKEQNRQWQMFENQDLSHYKLAFWHLRSFFKDLAPRSQYSHRTMSLPYLNIICMACIPHQHCLPGPARITDSLYPLCGLESSQLHRAQ